MDEEIQKEYEKIKDKISEEDFLKLLEEKKESYGDVDFMDDIDIARLITGEYITESVESKTDGVINKLEDLEAGQDHISVIGKVMSISNQKSFKTRKGNEGKLCNISIADDTANLRVTFWTNNIPLLNNFNEGDVIQINNVQVKEGFNKNTEIQLENNATIHVLNSDDYPDFPEYKENITDIGSITLDDDKVNIIGRIARLGRINTFNGRNGEGKVTNIKIQDATGSIQYTLWNKDVDLIDTLNLEQGDSVKILNASVGENRDEITLTHRNSRIIKGDFDLPDVEISPLLKIGDAEEVNDVTLIGIVSKIQDVITFTRKDGSDGFVRTVEITDDTGSIGVSLWGNDTKLDLKKGDILKIVGANIQYDDYSSSGYKVNTTWETSITINPKEPADLIEFLEENYAGSFGPIKIEQVQSIDEDGEEVDICGRVITIGDTREFQRDDGSIGKVKSVDFADETGLVSLSLWDEKSEDELNVGSAYLIENARTRLGMYDIQLNIGKTSRIIKLNDEESKYIASLDTLEELIYEHKNISELDEDDQNIKIVGRILSINPVNNFVKADGSEGSVRNIEIGDNTGSIRVAIWGPDPDFKFKVSDPIKIINPRFSFNNDALELSLNGNAGISTPTDKEIKALPSFEELQDIIYVSKTLDSVEEDDRNIRISGMLMNLSANNLLLSKCPTCNSRLSKDEDGYFCEYCGEEVDEPRYTLMLPGMISDETSEMQITFFGKLVEELLELSQEEIIDIVSKEGDIGPLEGKVENLDGMQIDLIADVRFNEFDEELRLSPKKIISKSF
ncbi:MAG: OB-fold nucleic acid binding domain-containing protein [Methanobrevibacter sp.]